MPSEGTGGADLGARKAWERDLGSTKPGASSLGSGSSPQTTWQSPSAVYLPQGGKTKAGTMQGGGPRRLTWGLSGHHGDLLQLKLSGPIVGPQQRGPKFR